MNANLQRPRSVVVFATRVRVSGANQSVYATASDGYAQRHCPHSTTLFITAHFRSSPAEYSVRRLLHAPHCVHPFIRLPKLRQRGMVHLFFWKPSHEQCRQIAEAAAPQGFNYSAVGATKDAPPLLQRLQVQCCATRYYAPLPSCYT